MTPRTCTICQTKGGHAPCCPRYPKRLCQHCRTRAVARPGRLCYPCYGIEDVRELYVNKTKFRPRKAPEYDPPELPGALRPRQYGEPAYRCLWCMRWRCDFPLKLCVECQLDCDAIHGILDELGDKACAGTASA